MKKIIGYFLLALVLALLYVGETLIFVFGNCHWAVIVFAPLGTFVFAALVVGVVVRPTIMSVTKGGEREWHT